jgi:hypothetical protein
MNQSDGSLGLVGREKDGTDSREISGGWAEAAGDDSSRLGPTAAAQTRI